jgi:hypothetical protein
VGVAAAVALVGFLAIGPLGLLDGGPGDVGAPADTTVPEPAEPTDTAPAISDTTAAPISLPSILVATGSEVVGGFDGETAADVPAPIAFDDLADGLVYQEASAWFSETAGTDIVHLPEGATGPVVLRAQEGDAAMRLMGVFDVEGASVAVVVERRNPGVVEEATEVMLEIDLSTGMTRDLAAVGGWESGPVAVSWDGEKYVVATVAEGSSYLHTLDRDGKSIPWFGLFRRDELPARRRHPGRRTPRLPAGHDRRRGVGRVGQGERRRIVRDRRAGRRALRGSAHRGRHRGGQLLRGGRTRAWPGGGREPHRHELG